MQIVVSEKMKEWVAGYIRSHRKEGTISIHTVYSKFNEDFRATFKTDPVVVVRLMEASGFLNGATAKGGYSIWLSEDSGKGQSRPYRPAKKKATILAETEGVVVDSQSAKCATGSEEDESTMEEKSNKLYAFEKVPHPETGKVGILALIGHIAKQLSSLPRGEQDIDGGYYIIVVNINRAFANIGIPTGSVPAISRIMQEMGITKNYGRGVWGVLLPDATPYFVTDRLYKIARNAMLDRTKRNSVTAKLRARVASLEKGLPTAELSASDQPQPSVSFEDEAIEALAEAERIAELLQARDTELQSLREEIARLEKELASRPEAAEAARNALRERLEAVKARAS